MKKKQYEELKQRNKVDTADYRNTIKYNCDTEEAFELLTPGQSH